MITAPCAKRWINYALNDSALNFEPETSQALGFGFRCGFLGMLHMEIVQERLEREYDIDLITTAPTVIYEVETHNGEVIMVDNPAKLPDPRHDYRKSGSRSFWLIFWCRKRIWVM